MGFRDNAYATVKEVIETTEYYTECKLSIGRKNKTTGQFELEFFGRARFMFDAHKSKPLVNQRILLKQTDTVTCYTDKEGNLKFLKYPQHKVYKYELQESQGASAPMPYNPYDNGVNFEDLSASEDTLPF